MENKKLGNFEIATISLIGISIFIYEVLFCNWYTLLEGRYNFSLFRIVVYMVFIILYAKFSNKFIEEAKKTLKYKKKIIIVYLIVLSIYTIYTYVTCNNYYVTFLNLLTEISGLLFILFVTKDYIKNIIITILTLGFMFSISVVVYHRIDEKNHFLSALNVASGNFYFYNGYTDKAFNDIEFKCSMPKFASKYFNTQYKMNMEKIPEDESIFSSLADYSPILYIPSALGINIGRFLGGSIADVFIAGRIFNLITYGILLIIIFKLLPFKKNLFYTIYLLPMAIVLATSYSVDGITTGLIGIFIAYTLKLYKENKEKISLKQFFILIGLFSLTLICKKASYLGICFIMCLLPILKSIQKDKKLLYSTLAIISIIIIIGIYQGNKIIYCTAGDSRGGDTNPLKQVEFLLESPTNILKVYNNFINLTIFNLDWYNGLNIKDFFGQRHLISGFLLFIFIFYTALTDSSYTFKNKEKIILFSTFLATFLITSFLLYLIFTPISCEMIFGYQTRYLIPILPLVLICVNTTKIKEYQIDEYNKTIMIMGLISILDLILLITK